MFLQENMMPDISIIVPVYNVAKYLDRTIRSLREQTYTNIEIILINDGSIDGSYEICKQAETEDERIRVINLQHCGVSAARNAGLDSAKGKYISFVDADDWLDADMLEYLVKKIEETNADISTCQFVKEYSAGKEVPNKKLNGLGEDVEQIVDEINYGGTFSAYLFTKLFKRVFIGTTRFERGVTIGEDYRFIIELLLRRPLIERGRECKYHYVQRADSVSYSGFINVESVYKNRKNYKETYELIRMSNPDLENGALAYYILQEMAVVISMVKANKTDNTIIKNVQKVIRKYLRRYIAIRKVPLYLKGCALLLSINEMLLLIPYKLIFHKVRSVA